MTQPQDPRTSPLQDDEVELARVLRALPAGEPSAKVDAAILAAATDALNRHIPAPTVAPRRAAKSATRWVLPTWAIGSAAAAVLAVGIGMQLRPPLGQEPVVQATAPAPRQELPEARERLSVELVEPEAAPLPQTAPPPSAPDQVRRRAPAPAAPPPPPPPPQVAQEPPAPAAVAAADDAYSMAAATEAAPSAEADAATLDSVEVTGSRLKAPEESGDRARRAHQNLYATRARAEAEAKAEALAREDVLAREETMARNEDLARQQAQAQAKASGQAAQPFGEAAAGIAAPATAAPSPTRSDIAEVLPPVAEDGKLPPDQWLERIRERLRQDDRAGARASLQRFIQTHPDVPVPADLDRLR